MPSYKITIPTPVFTVNAPTIEKVEEWIEENFFNGYGPVDWRAIMGEADDLSPFTITATDDKPNDGCMYDHDHDHEHEPCAWHD